MLLFDPSKIKKGGQKRESVCIYNDNDERVMRRMMVMTRTTGRTKPVHVKQSKLQGTQL